MLRRLLPNTSRPLPKDYVLEFCNRRIWSKDRNTAKEQNCVTTPSTAKIVRHLISLFRTGIWGSVCASQTEPISLLFSFFWGKKGMIRPLYLHSVAYFYGYSKRDNRLRDAVRRGTMTGAAQAIEKLQCLFFERSFRGEVLQVSLGWSAPWRQSESSFLMFSCRDLRTG